MKLKKKYIISAFVVFGILCTTAGVVAEDSLKQVEVYTNDQIKITLDGREYVPKEDDGSIMDTLIYNGRTYLPVAKIGEALNVSVGWDASKQQVTIWSTAGKSAAAAGNLPILPGNSSGNGRGFVSAPVINYDDSAAVITPDMSSYNFDKAFTSTHLTSLKKDEFNVEGNAHQFIFQAVKEYWNHSETTKKVKNKNMFSESALAAAAENHEAFDHILVNPDDTSDHPAYKKVWTGLRTLTEELDPEFSTDKVKIYKLLGTVDYSEDGGESYYHDKEVKGNITLQLDAEGNYNVADVHLQFVVPIPRPKSGGDAASGGAAGEAAGGGSGGSSGGSGGSK